MQSFFRTILALVAVALVSNFSAAQAQEGDTAVVGGPGGGQDVDRCPNGYLLVGMVYQGNKDINTVQALCRQFVDGRGTGYAISLRTWGARAEDTGSVFDPNVFPPGAVYCADQTAVQAISVGVSAGNVNLVHDFAFTCRNPLSHQYNDAARSRIAGGNTDYTESADCGGGAIANGIVVRHGSLIDALGLHCLTNPPPDKPVKSVRPASGNSSTSGSNVVVTPTPTPAELGGLFQKQLNKGPGIAMRATVAGMWNFTRGSETYRLQMVAQGTGLAVISNADIDMIPVAGNLTNTSGDTGKDGGFSGQMMANRQVLINYSQKNGGHGTCLLTYSGDAKTLAGQCSDETGQSFNFNGSRGQ